jgi:glycosyltransferase involved in cell wall biosynthesis
VGVKKFSCLICAYNEAPRITKVLEVATKHPWLDEVVVVDDGSTDGTAEVVKSFKRVKLVAKKKNEGKTKALEQGLALAKNPWILTLDADLRNLKAQDLTALLQPLRVGQAEMSISIRKNTLLVMKWMGIDFVSGERVFNKKLLIGHEKELKKLPRFGFEVFLNGLFIQSRGRLAIVPLLRVSHARKSEKVGWLKGHWEELKMILDILKTVGLKKIIFQNRALLKRARDV